MLKNYSRKITIAAMILVIAVFYLTSRNYIFNKNNEIGGFVFINTTLSIWNESNPADYNFCPVLTYSNSGDKYVTYYKRLEDKEGNNYFVSQPPFSCILAYYFLSAFQLPMDIASIKLLNFIVLAAGSILVYLIVNLVAKKRLLDFSFAALISMIVFLFIPINNYAAASTYAPELLFWLFSILFFLKIILQRPQKMLYYLLLGISVFLVTYTDWVGLFFGCSILFYCILHYKDKLFRTTFMYVFLFMGLSLFITFLQYSSLNGTADMIHAMKIRFLGRSGLFGAEFSELRIHIFSFSSWMTFLEKINRAMAGFGYLMIIFAAVFIILRKKINANHTPGKIIFFPVILPLLIHFIILFNSNAIHLCYMAKTSVPIAIFSGMLFGVLNQNPHFSFRKGMLLLLVVITAVASHFVTNTYYPMVTDLQIPKKQGAYIQKHALPDEAVFICRDTTSDFFADYFLTYLSSRNLRYAEGKDDAMRISRELKKAKGIYFDLNPDTSLIKINRFNLQSKNSDN